MKFVLGILLSYFIGSFPTAYLVGKMVRGIDIRRQGSGNVGASNVFRVVGKKWGVAVLLFDILKGLTAACLVPSYFSSQRVPPFLTALSFGFAAVIGHTWTLWLGFHGGKGVATSLGVLLGLVPRAAGMGLLIWGLLFWWKRYVSLASVGMAVSFPLWIFCFYRERDFFHALFPLSLMLTFFILYTHRGNIRRLQDGTEKRLI